jgi:hypothetical protein
MLDLSVLWSCRGLLFMNRIGRKPSQFAHGADGVLSADEPPCVARTAGVGVPRGGNAEGAGLGNRFAQEVDQGVVDAGVFDASRSEQKFHHSSP